MIVKRSDNLWSDENSRWLFFNGDCVEIMSRMRSQIVDICVTDPPYGIGYKNNHRRQHHDLLSTEIKNDQDLSIVEAATPQIYRLLKEGAALFMFCRDDVLGGFQDIIVNAGFTLKNTIIWNKTKQTGGDLEGQFGRQYEMIVFAVKGTGFKLRGKRYSDIWSASPVQNRIHPHQKPISLVAKALKSSADENAIVLDPFSGSATVAVAAKQLGMRCISIELDEKRFPPLIKRFSSTFTPYDLVSATE